MGTYTSNYNLFMPTVGETGWGTLVNGNFTTIDTTMKGLDTRIATVEPLSVIQVDENQNATFPAKITASEFVGGVGNFESGIISGELNVEGSVSSPVLKYTGNLGVNGTEIIATIPRVNGNSVTGATFPNTRITFGKIPFPHYSQLINIEDAIYPETINVKMTLMQNSVSQDAAMVGRIYKDDTVYGTITIPAYSGSGSSTINVPYWDDSIWSIGYASGYQFSNNTINAYINPISLYRP